MDAAGCASRKYTLVVLLFAIVFCAAGASAQDSSGSEAEIARLFKAGQWQEIVNLKPPLDRSPQIDLQYGIALARLQRWGEAQHALQAGLRLSPRDPELMVELAGVAFKQARYALAETWMHRALRYASKDSYNFDFLATCYYLQGNLEAALKYWNKIGKPHIASLQPQPTPEFNPVLLDRAFTFSAASVLRLSDLRTTQARIDELDVFSTYRFNLTARPDGNFDLFFNNSERHGCAGNSWQCLLLVFGETPAQTVNFSYFDIGARAINASAAFRWDGEKRREQAQIELPLSGRPSWQLRAGVDLRNENWAVRRSFVGPAPMLGAFNLKREAAAAQFTDVMSGRWRWSEETELSERAYHNVFTGTLLTPALLSQGFQLKQSFALQSRLVSWPERRLTVDASGMFSAAKLWSTPTRFFSQIQGMVRLHWFPQPTGEKYELQHLIRVGRSFGDVPFDQVFVLGVLGDTDLYMRAHIATRDGKKGSAPLGSNYFLSNWEATRDVSPTALFYIKVGPFVDTGALCGPTPGFGSQGWLWDTGLEAKLQAFGFSVTLSYGRDLRAGRNAWVASAP